jgi:protein gp37
MGENSNIEWCDHSFNPWEGCQKVSPGCDHCYAEARDKRFTGGQLWGPHAPRRRTSPANWRKPLAWNKAAEAAGKRARVFCASLADVFDNHDSIENEWRHDLWRLIHATPHLDWLLLTKRPQNIRRYLPDQLGLGFHPQHWGNGWQNVCLGTTVENQTEADRRIPHLLATPAAVRFLSCEPLLGPVDLTRFLWIGPEGGIDFSYTPRQFLHWVICGGESGPGARPMHPSWARSLRDQCQAAGVAFHFKQQGEWSWGGFQPETGSATPERAGWIVPDGRWCRTTDGAAAELCEAPGAVPIVRVGKARAGRLLDGRTWDQFPGVW